MTPARLRSSTSRRHSPRRPNELVAVVVRWSDASFVQDHDQWWQAGISRSVDAGGAGLGVRRVRARGRGRFWACVTWTAARSRRSWFDGRGRVVLRRASRAGLGDWHPAPRLWSAEEPSLYTLRLDDGTGPVPAESASGRSRSATGSCSSRRRALIRGVNRHDHDDPPRVRCRPSGMERDARLMKQSNVNAIRTSHYPNDPYWLDLLRPLRAHYVIDEANIESHAYYHELCRDPLRGGVPRAHAQPVERDKNHPRHLLVARQRERLRPNHDAAAGWIRGRDPSRPLHTRGRSVHRGRAGPGPRTSSARCTPSSARSSSGRDHDGRASAADHVRVLHAMGNSNGGLADYFAAFDRHERLQGFIWEWIDHGTAAPTPMGASTGLRR